MSALDASSLEFWETFADFGAWIVLIGVAGEGLEIALKICGHKVKNERFHNWYDEHEFSIEVWGAFFWIMVVAGLAVELKGSHKAQQIVKGENSRITKEASDAKKDAAVAIEHAAEATRLAAIASKDAEEAKLARVQLEVELAALEPSRQPITQITGRLSLKFAGTNALEVINPDRHREEAIFGNLAWVHLETSDHGRSTNFWHMELSADRYQQLFLGEDNVQYFLDLHTMPTSPMEDLGKKSVAEVNRLDELIIQLWFLPARQSSEFRLMDGTLDLTVNFSPFRYKIPPQTNLFPHFTSLRVVITNAVPAK